MCWRRSATRLPFAAVTGTAASTVHSPQGAGEDGMLDRRDGLPQPYLLNVFIKARTSP